MKFAASVLDPRHERGGLIVKAQPVQAIKREGGVAYPGVAIVPIASLADGFGEAESRCRRDGPIALARQHFQGQRGTADHLAPTALERRRFLGGHRELNDGVAVFVPQGHIWRAQPQDEPVLTLRDEQNLVLRGLFDPVMGTRVVETWRAHHPVAHFPAHGFHPAHQLRRCITFTLLVSGHRHGHEIADFRHALRRHKTRQKDV